MQLGGVELYGLAWSSNLDLILAILSCKSLELDCIGPVVGQFEDRFYYAGLVRDLHVVKGKLCVLIPSL